MSDLPDFLKMEIRYKTNEYVPKYDKNGKEVIWKIDDKITGLQIFIFHPDFRSSFLQKFRAAGIRAVEFSPIEIPEEDKEGGEE